MNRRIIIIIAALAMAFVFTAAHAEIPLGYPWSTWGEISWSEGDNSEGLKADTYFEQGIDWWEYSGWTFNTFAGLRLVASSESDDYWNNKVGLWLGAKASHGFQLFPNSSGMFNLGYRWEWYNYFGESFDDSRNVLFASWWTGGSWATGKFPLAWPWSTWGELSYAYGDYEDGLKLDAYAEQGVVVAEVDEWAITPFVGLRAVLSSESGDYWNNKIGPWVGIKGSRAVGNGVIQVGVRGEYYTYTDSDQDNDLRGVVFLTWWFGGDHKKK